MGEREETPLWSNTVRPSRDSGRAGARRATAAAPSARGVKVGICVDDGGWVWFENGGTRVRSAEFNLRLIAIVPDMCPWVGYCYRRAAAERTLRWSWASWRSGNRFVDAAYKVHGHMCACVFVQTCIIPTRPTDSNNPPHNQTHNINHRC